MAKRFWPKGAPAAHLLKEGQNVNLAIDGIMHSAPGGHPKAQYPQASDERVIHGPGGGRITLGTDMPTSQASGYGAKGVTGLASPGSGRCEIVVGPASSARGGDGPVPGSFVANNYSADAARLLICETTDVDKNFGLVEGVVGNPKGQSCFVGKADQVRLIGRAGIKIITGGGNNVRGFGMTGETNSKGGKLAACPGIDLIAGNNVEPRKVRGPNFLPEEVQTLQPVALGYNTRDAFLELSQILDDILSMQFNLARETAEAFGKLAVGLAASVVPFAGPAAMAATAFFMGKAGISIAAKVLPSIHQTRCTKVVWQVNYLQPFGYKFIGSRSVRTT